MKWIWVLLVLFLALPVCGTENLAFLGLVVESDGSILAVLGLPWGVGLTQEMRGVLEEGLGPAVGKGGNLADGTGTYIYYPLREPGPMTRLPLPIAIGALTEGLRDLGVEVTNLSLKIGPGYQLTSRGGDPPLKEAYGLDVYWEWGGAGRLPGEFMVEATWFRRFITLAPLFWVAVAAWASFAWQLRGWRLLAWHLLLPGGLALGVAALAWSTWPETFWPALGAWVVLIFAHLFEPALIIWSGALPLVGTEERAQLRAWARLFGARFGRVLLLPRLYEHRRVAGVSRGVWPALVISASALEDLTPDERAAALAPEFLGVREKRGLRHVLGLTALALVLTIGLGVGLVYFSTEVLPMQLEPWVNRGYVGGFVVLALASLVSLSRWERKVLARAAKILGWRVEVLVEARDLLGRQGTSLNQWRG